MLVSMLYLAICTLAVVQGRALSGYYASLFENDDSIECKNQIEMC